MALYTTKRPKYHKITDIGWPKITDRCKNFLTGNVDKDSHKKRKVALLVDRTGADGYAIDGFKFNRNNEFETKIMIMIGHWELKFSLKKNSCTAVDESNGFAEAVQKSVVKPGNGDHFWPIGDDL